MNATISMQPIGIIHSPFLKVEDMPIQPIGAKAAPGHIVLLPEYMPGLKDLDGFSHLILIYYFHQAGPVALTVTPFLDTQEHGIFATRAPVRPNHIGISTVELEAIKGGTILLKNVDILDGTPLLDIKPFVPDFDVPSGLVRTGWLESCSDSTAATISDDRFK